MTWEMGLWTPIIGLSRQVEEGVTIQVEGLHPTQDAKHKPGRLPICRWLLGQDSSS